MNNEQLKAWNNSPVNLNWGDDFLGKLYLFPVTESELKAQGIEKQWFLTHQKGDRLVSGHINNKNQWSLCHPQDLTPTYDYYGANQLWELLAGDNFVVSLNSLTKVQSNHQSGEKTKIIDSDDSSEDEPWSDSTKLESTEEKEVAINLRQTPFSSLSLDQDVEAEAEPETEPAENERDKLEKKEKKAICPQEQSPCPISEEQRQLLEQDLRTILWQGYQADLLDLEAQEAAQPWMIELDGDYLKLTSTVDQHLVLAITKTGEIKEHLSLADADLLINNSAALEKQGNQCDSSPQINREKQSQAMEIE